MHLLLLALLAGRDLPGGATPKPAPPPAPPARRVPPPLASPVHAIGSVPPALAAGPTAAPPPIVEASPASPPVVATTAPADLSSAEQLTLLHGGHAAPDAWLALWRGDAWVCWRPAPDCWQRLDLLGSVDVGLLRAEFTGPSSLVLGDRSEATWRIDQGDPTPRPAQANPTAGPRQYACGPAGPLPVVADGHLRFTARPCVATALDAHLCVSRARGGSTRPVAGLRVRVGLELRILEDWQQSDGAAAATGFTLLALLGLGWDSGVQLRRERADLQAQARPGLRTLPALRSRGPLAAAERDALVAVLCGGAT